MSSEETVITPATGSGKAAAADVEEAMKDVVDPELGINVVDIGLVYGVHIDDDNLSGGVRQAAKSAGFSGARPVIEVRGTCGDCGDS